MATPRRTATLRDACVAAQAALLPFATMNAFLQDREFQTLYQKWTGAGTARITLYDFRRAAAAHTLLASVRPARPARPRSRS